MPVCCAAGCAMRRGWDDALTCGRAKLYGSKQVTAWSTGAGGLPRSMGRLSAYSLPSLQSNALQPSDCRNEYSFSHRVPRLPAKRPVADVFHPHHFDTVRYKTMSRKCSAGPWHATCLPACMRAYVHTCCAFLQPVRYAASSVAHEVGLADLLAFLTYCGPGACLWQHSAVVLSQPQHAPRLRCRPRSSEMSKHSECTQIATPQASSTNVVRRSPSHGYSS
jgi:hypothetical protein